MLRCCVRPMVLYRELVQGLPLAGTRRDTLSSPKIHTEPAMSALQDLPSRLDRKALSGPALRSFFRIADFGSSRTAPDGSTVIGTLLIAAAGLWGLSQQRAAS